MTELAASSSTPQQHSAQSEASDQTVTTPSVPDFRTTKHKLKIEGKEVEWDYDRLVAEASKGHVADRKFDQAAQIKKQVDEVIGGLRGKDMTALKKLAQAVGPDAFRELAENYLLEHIEYERLPDTDKARIAAEKRAKELEEELETRDKSAKEEQRTQAKQIALQEIDTEISEALKLYPKALPNEAKNLVAARIVERMLANMSSNGSRLPAAKAAELEFQGLERELKGYLASKSVEELRGILPKNLLDGLRKADVELARGQFPRSGKPQESVSLQKSKKPMRTKTDSWFEEMEKRLG
jgi:hypothetical protein